MIGGFQAGVMASSWKISGSNLIANAGPNFLNTSGWLSGGLSTLGIVSGKLRITSIAVWGRAGVTITTVPGVRYVILADLLLISGGRTMILKEDQIIGSGTNYVQNASSDRLFFVAAANTTVICIGNESSAGVTELKSIGVFSIV